MTAGKIMIDDQTTSELDAARGKYRDQVIPQPVLTLMDLHMPGFGGVDAIYEIRAANPNARTPDASPQ
jgi:CheY-like chemotaxis protein